MAPQHTDTVAVGQAVDRDHSRVSPADIRSTLAAMCVQECHPGGRPHHGMWPSNPSTRTLAVESAIGMQGNTARVAELCRFRADELRRSLAPVAVLPLTLRLCKAHCARLRKFFDLTQTQGTLLMNLSAIETKHDIALFKHDGPDRLGRWSADSCPTAHGVRETSRFAVRGAMRNALAQLGVGATSTHEDDGHGCVSDRFADAVVAMIFDGLTNGADHARTLTDWYGRGEQIGLEALRGMHCEHTRGLTRWHRERMRLVDTLRRAVGGLHTLGSACSGNQQSAASATASEVWHVFDLFRSVQRDVPAIGRVLCRTPALLHAMCMGRAHKDSGRDALVLQGVSEARDELLATASAIINRYDAASVSVHAACDIPVVLRRGGAAPSTPLDSDDAHAILAKEAFGALECAWSDGSSKDVRCGDVPFLAASIALQLVELVGLRPYHAPATAIAQAARSALHDVERAIVILGQVVVAESSPVACAAGAPSSCQPAAHAKGDKAGCGSGGARRSPVHTRLARPEQTAVIAECLIRAAEQLYSQLEAVGDKECIVLSSQYRACWRQVSGVQAKVYTEKLLTAACSRAGFTDVEVCNSLASRSRAILIITGGVEDAHAWDDAREVRVVGLDRDDVYLHMHGDGTQDALRKGVLSVGRAVCERRGHATVLTTVLPKRVNGAPGVKMPLDALACRAPRQPK